MPELLFDDLSFFNSIIPIKREKWAAQPESVLNNIALAHPLAIDTAEAKPIITLRLYRSAKFKLSLGDKFRLLRRFVDFNLPKILRNFLEVDLETRTSPSFLLNLIENPSQVGGRVFPNSVQLAKEETRMNSMYRQLRELGLSDAVQLVFQRSQHRAMQSILKRQATIIWGPPGTGKTHTLALSLLYLLEILYLIDDQKVMVWITAVTNAAIEMFVSKFEFLCDRVRAIPNLQKEWLDEVKVLRLTAGAKPDLPKSRFVIAAGTVWQLWNWNEKHRRPVNVLIIDESGQMNVGTAALAIRWLHVDGRLIGNSSHCYLTSSGWRPSSAFPNTERTISKV